MRSNRPGQSLIEIVVATGLFAVIVSTLAPLALNPMTQAAIGREHTQAAFLAAEGIQAARAIAGGGIGTLANGTYGVAVAGGAYQLAPAPDTVGGYTRTLAVQDAYWNGSVLQPMDCGGCTAFPGAKVISASVTWAPVLTGRTPSVTLSTVLTDWR